VEDRRSSVFIHWTEWTPAACGADKDCCTASRTAAAAAHASGCEARSVAEGDRDSKLAVGAGGWRWGLIVTNDYNRDQQRLSEQGQITDRFTKAVEQLGQTGPEKVDVRLGAIYALQRIMRDSADDQPAVVDILSAFVRVHSPAPSPTQLKSFIREDGKIRPLIRRVEDESPPLPVDVQASLTVLGSRNPDRDGESHIDLSRTNLRGVDLSGAHLSEVILYGAYLGQATLDYADMSSADLRGARLYGATLGRTNLHEALLTGASLDTADFNSANLSDAWLNGATLTLARLDFAELRGAHLNGADLRNAQLSESVTREQLSCAYVDKSTTGIPFEWVPSAPPSEAERLRCLSRPFG
jgi:uncharacterized protein YjbI with pentapeptide repeats